MEHEPILLIGTHKITLRYAHHKPFKIHLPENSEWQNGFAQIRKGDLVWYTVGFKTNEGTGAGVYRWGSNEGLASVSGSTPRYSKQKNMILRPA
jgi:hypothetical protein